MDQYNYTAIHRIVEKKIIELMITMFDYTSIVDTTSYQLWNFKEW